MDLESNANSDLYQPGVSELESNPFISVNQVSQFRSAIPNAFTSAVHEADSTSLAELPDNLAELSTPTLPRGFQQPMADPAGLGSASYRAPSGIVSPLSSFHYSTDSDESRPWRMTQSFAFSNTTPTMSTPSTSFDETVPIGFVHNFTSPQFPTLHLMDRTYNASDTNGRRLFGPQELVLDVPLTDSPVEGSAEEFLDLHSRPFNFTPEHRTPTTSISNMLHADDHHMMDIGNPIQNLQPQFQEQRTTSRVEARLATGSQASTETSHSLSSADALDAAPEDMSTTQVPQRLLQDLLDACTQYAQELSHQCPAVMASWLDETFKLGVSYFEQNMNLSNEYSSTNLGQMMDTLPTTEAALNTLATMFLPDESISGHGLLSLVFFSFFLLCSAILDEGRLVEAVATLHDQARAWSNKIASQRERNAYEIMVDSFWLMAERNNLAFTSRPTPLPLNNAALGATCMVHGSPCIVMEVAQIFINVTAHTSMNRSCDSSTHNDLIHFDPPPSFEEAVREDVLGTAANAEVFHLIQHGMDTKALSCFEQVDDVLQDYWNSVDVSIPPPLKQRYKEWARTARNLFQRRIVKWFAQELKNSARRVVSSPQGFAPAFNNAGPSRTTRRSHTAVRETGAIFHDLNGQNSGAGAIPSSSRQRRRRQPALTARSPDSASWQYYCPIHNIGWNGPHAHSAYHRHMNHTILHNAKGYKCVKCPLMFPRADRLKQHALEIHQSIMRGRSGKYTFEAI